MTNHPAKSETNANVIFTFNLENQAELYEVSDGSTISGFANVINLDSVWINIEMIGSFNGTSDVVTYSDKYIVLSPFESKRIPFSINIPLNYCSGTYKASLKAKAVSFQYQQASLATGISLSAAVGKRMSVKVNSSNACPTTVVVASSGGGGGGSSSSGGGGSSSSGGGGGSGVGSSTVSTSSTPVSRFDVTPTAEPVTTTPPKDTTDNNDTTIATSNSCLLLNSDTDSVAGAEVLNPQNARLLAIEKKVVEKYGKIIKKFENKTKIKSVFRDMRKRDSLRYIAALYDMGILADLSDKNFKPNKNVNRAEFLKLVILATNEKFSQKNLKAIAAFEDVHKRSWYAKYIAYGLNNKLIEGYSDKTFKPKNPVNQVEALKMIFTTFGIKPETGLNYSYQDVPLDVWYKDIAYTSIYHCIVKQPKNGKFIPNKIITREEAALLIYRVLKIQDDQSRNGVYTAIVGQK